MIELIAWVCMGVNAAYMAYFCLVAQFIEFLIDFVEDEAE